MDFFDGFLLGALLSALICGLLLRSFKRWVRAKMRGDQADFRDNDGMVARVIPFTSGTTSAIQPLMEPRDPDESH